jgi:ABC-type cobalamin/Fe3+-siderophores transport system ATPase subunit
VLDNVLVGAEGVNAGANSFRHVFAPRREFATDTRSLAGPYDFILLDEPSSGLDAAETAAIARVLRDAGLKECGPATDRT